MEEWCKISTYKTILLNSTKLNICVNLANYEYWWVIIKETPNVKLFDKFKKINRRLANIKPRYGEHFSYLCE